MRAEKWFRPFVIRHTEMVPRADWPAPTSDFWFAWWNAFAKRGITEAVARDASALVAESPPPFLDRHLPAFLEAARQVFAASEVREAPADQEDARAQSRHCDDCMGNGLAVRFRHDGKPGPESFTCYCLCPFGRFLERSHATGDEAARAVHDRTPDLANRFDLQLRPVAWSKVPDNRHRHRPSAWDAANNRPVDHAAYRPASLTRMLQRAQDRLATR